MLKEINNNTKKEKLKILLVGQINPCDIEFHYKEAFEFLGHEVSVIDYNSCYSISLWNRILNRTILTFLMKIKKEWGIRAYFNLKGLNTYLIKKTKEFLPDFIFFVKPIYIKSTTIVEIKKLGIKTFSYFPDDEFNPRTTSRIFLKTLSKYDCHFTTKSYNVPSLMKRAKKVLFIPHAANINLYYFETIPEEEKKKLGADIVFIGSYYEKYRGDILEKLCKRGYNIKVYGNRWQRYKGKCLRERNCLMFKPAEGDEYRRVMNSSKIALGLLAKVIPEQHTHRTFEIPACGTFMLHERTPEAMSFFKEGVEAEYFGSFEELVEKIDYYLTHEEERKKIAEAGYKKAHSYECSYLARAQKIIDVYWELKEKNE